MKIRIYKTSKDHDSDEIRFIDNGEEKGFGFKAKDDGKIGLEKCPKCGKENYAMNVLSGVCTWCSFDANKIKFE